MFQSKIEAAPFNLFDAQIFDIGLCPKGVGTRKASDEEAGAYMRWLADKSGFTRFPEIELAWRSIGTGAKCHRVCIGARFGRELSPASWKEKRPAQYETGAYCLIMPGANQRDTVTMETLDESGAVVASQTLPVEPKKRGVIWDKAAIARAVGPVAKPAKAKGRRVAQEGAIGAMGTPSPTVEMPAPAPITPAADESRDALALQVEQLAATVAKMQGYIDTLLLHALEVPGVVLPDVTPIGELTDNMDAPVAIMDDTMDASPTAVLTPWGGAKAMHQARADYEAEAIAATRAKRLRIVQRYLSMRVQREAMRAQLYDISVQLAHVSLERDTARRDVMRLKAAPHHLGNEVRPDDVKRLTVERDTARASVVSLTEEAARLRKSVGQGADMLDQMVERALRAEIALKAVEGRAERGSTPYRINGAAVTFAVAA
jgi:hypothetical protein